MGELIDFDLEVKKIKDKKFKKIKDRLQHELVYGNPETTYVLVALHKTANESLTYDKFMATIEGFSIELKKQYQQTGNLENKKTYKILDEWILEFKHIKGKRT